ncbi:Protein PET100, mitochondrial [Neolecta irregularis DAH-3]|uniref:Protein PET100, mitochondrial n=1 Tax=Neolecta irregularis (strain DAH-3) TaxID=1198029 RepID=A0A1U7LI20_NEOID|nr:Protein PET100, mitochondrial [Neolecta irregularis DAH-3]|eukprot:OLL22243.1 Protein PET100, mitochondrial [Neolecta irregularis DAH-3]
MYVMFPVAAMWYFGSPLFYDNHVKPVQFWPQKECTQTIPTQKEEWIAELQRLREERLAKRQEGKDP